MLGGLWMVLATAPVWPRGGSDPPAARPSPEAVSLAHNVSLVDFTSDGQRVRIEVREIVRRTGRRGFLRSPLLQGTALRDLRVWIDDELVAERDEFVLPRFHRPGGDPTQALSLEAFEDMVNELLSAAS